MKSKILIFLVLFSGLSIKNIFAQDSKFLFGGSIGFGYSSDKSNETSSFFGDSKTINISTSPMFGYSITDNFVIGIALENNLNNTTYDGQTYDYMKQSDYLLSPFVRYYINSPLFIHGQGNFGGSKQETKGDIYIEGIGQQSLDSKSKSSVVGFGLGVGYDIELSDNVKLEPLVKYIFNNYKYKEGGVDYKNSNIIFNLGLIYRFKKAHTHNT